MKKYVDPNQRPFVNCRAANGSAIGTTFADIGHARQPKFRPMLSRITTDASSAQLKFSDDRV